MRSYTLIAVEESSPTPKISDWVLAIVRLGHDYQLAHLHCWRDVDPFSRVPTDPSYLMFCEDYETLWVTTPIELMNALYDVTCAEWLASIAVPQEAVLSTFTPTRSLLLVLLQHLATRADSYTQRVYLGMDLVT